MRTPPRSASSATSPRLARCWGNAPHSGRSPRPGNSGRDRLELVGDFLSGAVTVEEVQHAAQGRVQVQKRELRLRMLVLQAAILLEGPGELGFPRDQFFG